MAVMLKLWGTQRQIQHLGPWWCHHWAAHLANLNTALPFLKPCSRREHTPVWRLWSCAFIFVSKTSLRAFLMFPFPAGQKQVQWLTPELSQVESHGHQSHVTCLTTRPTPWDLYFPIIFTWVALWVHFYPQRSWTHSSPEVRLSRCLPQPLHVPQMKAPPLSNQPWEEENLEVFKCHLGARDVAWSLDSTPNTQEPEYGSTSLPPQHSRDRSRGIRSSRLFLAPRSLRLALG